MQFAEIEQGRLVDHTGEGGTRLVCSGLVFIGSDDSVSGHLHLLWIPDATRDPGMDRKPADRRVIVAARIYPASFGCLSRRPKSNQDNMRWIMKKFQVSQWKGMESPYIRAMFLKNAAAIGLSVAVVGIAAALADIKAVIFPALFVAAYFLFNAAVIVWNAAAGRYIVVRAAAVACEDRVNAIRQKRSVYRFIPVDGNGSYLDTQGNYDIFIEVAGKKKCAQYNFFVGRTYILVFCKDNGGGLDERTLAAVYPK